MEQTDDGQGGGGKSETPPAPQSSSNNPPPQGEGDNFDDFGYPKDPSATPGDKGQEGKTEDKPKPNPPAEPPKEVKPATGYEAEPPPPQDPPPPPPPPKEEVKLDFELKLEGLEAAEVEKLKTQVKKYGLAQEAAQAMVDDRKAEITRAQESAQAAQRDFDAKVQKQKSDWFKELKNDPNFGGEKFKQNVSQVEKVVEEFMPELKKSLTEGGTMLPPNVMRGLLRVATTLYSTEQAVQGGPVTPPKEDNESKDPFAFLGDMYQ